MTNTTRTTIRATLARVIGAWPYPGTPDPFAEDTIPPVRCRPCCEWCDPDGSCCHPGLFSVTGPGGRCDLDQTQRCHICGKDVPNRDL